MKEIEWQNCVTHGAIGNYPPENGKILHPNDTVRRGMKVSSRYNDITVILEIKSEIEEQVFSASVLSFEELLTDEQLDICPGDVVKIQRQHICWLFG